MVEYNMADESNYQLHKIGEINIKAEKSYEFDQLYGEGHVYNSIKNHTDEFAKILSDRGDVSSERGTVGTYDMWFNGFTKYVDGNDSNGELIDVWMTDKGDMHAGVLYVKSKYGTLPYFIGDEKTTYLIREFFKKYQ